MSNIPTNQKTALLVVCLSSFIMPLMLSSVNVAIPAIAVSMNADAILLSWVSTAYLLSSAVFLLPFGKLADILGRKKIYLWGMFITTLASLLAATSQSIFMLIAWRVMQGVGAAMLFATGIAILSSVFPPERRGSAIGLTVSAVYFGLTCGPLFGGWLTQHFSWRSVFVVHIPVAVFVMLITKLKLTGEWRGQSDQKLDVAGSFIYALAITSLMLGLSLLPSVFGILMLILSAVSLTGFIKYENRISSPIFEVSIFRQNRILTYSCLASLILYTATFGLTFLMSLYLQNIKGMSPQTAGLVMISQPLVMAVLSPYTGKLSDRYEPRYLTTTGMCLITLGLGLLAALQQHSSLTYILISLVLIGLGFALFSSPNMNAIMGSVDKKHLGIASGTVSTTRVLGQMFSMAVVTLAFALLMGPVPLSPEHYPALLQSIRVSLFTAACLSVVGIYLSMVRGNVR
jgi:EmrB/QacA subfamily drug resistance transporter